MRPIDARVDDPDQHVWIPRADAVRPIRGRVNHLHVPLQVGERLRSEKVLSKEIEADLKRAIDEYKKVAVSGKPSFTAASL